MSDVDETDETEAAIQRLEAKRAARLEAAAKARKRQLLKDMEAHDDLAVEYGDDRVGYVDVSHVPGLPVRLVVRAPTHAEMKNYRDSARGKKDSVGQASRAGQAAEDIARMCLLYPKRDDFEEVARKFPGVPAQLGGVAIAMALGEAEEREKN